jgi:hypothetical protein
MRHDTRRRDAKSRSKLPWPMTHHLPTSIVAATTIVHALPPQASHTASGHPVV